MDKVKHDYKYPSLLFRDPMNITELRTLINEASRRRQAAVQVPSQLEGMCYLLPEIKCLIVETLEDRRDIANLLIAFQWQLPDRYWRARFPKGIVFEFEDLICREIDWQYRYLGVLRLLKTSHGLRNDSGY